MTEKAYRYRFYPTSEQEDLLRRTLGCVRLVYNDRTGGANSSVVRTKGTSGLLSNIFNADGVEKREGIRLFE
jgi:transposase